MNTHVVLLFLLPTVIHATIISHASPQRVSIGHTATLSCQSSSVSDRISWYVNDSTIFNTERINIYQYTNTSYLTIRSVVKSDANYYWCEDKSEQSGSRRRIYTRSAVRLAVTDAYKCIDIIDVLMFTCIVITIDACIVLSIIAYKYYVKLSNNDNNIIVFTRVV